LVKRRPRLGGEQKRSKHQQHFTMAVGQPDDGRPQ